VRPRRAACAAIVVAGYLATVQVSGQQRSTDQPRSLLTPSLAGQDVFKSYCAPCHGQDGTGHGPVASALKTSPANLTLLARRNGGTYPRAAVEAFVTGGKTSVEAHGSSDMPVWGPTFRALEPSDRLVKARIKSVVDYVQSIQAR